MLPEPPVTLSLLQGGKLVLDDRTLPEVSFSTITFRKEFIDQHAEGLRGFLAAIEEAVRLINADPANTATCWWSRKSSRRSWQANSKCRPS